jgi:hypothetical protein
MVNLSLFQNHPHTFCLTLNFDINPEVTVRLKVSHVISIYDDYW